MTGATEILDSLHEDYYAPAAGRSAVTSSHWKVVGGHSVLRDRRIGWKLRGYGFGDFRRDHFLNRARFSVESLLVQGLFKKHIAGVPVIRAAKAVAERSGRLFDFDCAKQALSVQAILDTLSGEERTSKTFSQLGITTVFSICDGYGYMGSLLRELDPDVRVVFVNLGKTLLFDAYYAHQVHPEARLANLEKQTELADMMFLAAEQFESLAQMSIDLFINIASMQEMDPAIVASYFRLMRESQAEQKYFYCCNRLEKRLPAGELVRFNEYPWQDAKILLDELCPWYQLYPNSRPPFWRPFDGPVQHRMVRF